jgi:2-polyprenyl-3-methyl-5-hydroxy-6-metoxy-1,4-benzoquinol methylase
VNADPDWFLDEKFWATLYPFVFPEDTFEAARKQVEAVVALTGRTAGTMLDLACGPGRHAIPFAQRGFRVTAVDYTP